TLGQKPFRITRRQVLESLFMLVKSRRDIRPVGEDVQNLIKTAQETAQLIASRFDIDGTGVNSHESTGENTAAADRKIGADEAEGSNFDCDLAGAVERIGNLDE